MSETSSANWVDTSYEHRPDGVELTGVHFVQGIPGVNAAENEPISIDLVRALLFAREFRDMNVRGKPLNIEVFGALWRRLMKTGKMKESVDEVMHPGKISEPDRSDVSRLLEIEKGRVRFSTAVSKVYEFNNTNVYSSTDQMKDSAVRDVVINDVDVAQRDIDSKLLLLPQNEYLLDLLLKLVPDEILKGFTGKRDERDAMGRLAAQYPMAEMLLIKRVAAQRGVLLHFGREKGHAALAEAYAGHYPRREGEPRVSQLVVMPNEVEGYALPHHRDVKKSPRRPSYRVKPDEIKVRLLVDDTEEGLGEKLEDGRKINEAALRHYLGRAVLPILELVARTRTDAAAGIQGLLTVDSAMSRLPDVARALHENVNEPVARAVANLGEFAPTLPARRAFTPAQGFKIA